MTKAVSENEYAWGLSVITFFMIIAEFSLPDW